MLFIFPTFFQTKALREKHRTIYFSYCHTLTHRSRTLLYWQQAMTILAGGQETVNTPITGKKTSFWFFCPLIQATSFSLQEICLWMFMDLRSNKEQMTCICSTWIFLWVSSSCEATYSVRIYCSFWPIQSTSICALCQVDIFFSRSLYTSITHQTNSGHEVVTLMKEVYLV